MSQDNSFAEFFFAMRRKSHYPQPVVSFPEFLFECRKEAHCSQQELAEKVGVSRRTEIRWERGEALPSITNLGRLADALQISYVRLKPYLALYTRK